VTDRPKQCPHCGNIPVKSKTWSLITKQDDLLGKLRKRVEELKDALRDARNNTKDSVD
jgi:predicted  nucleic acid-binding Zn-ribbon protein